MVRGGCSFIPYPIGKKFPSSLSEGRMSIKKGQELGDDQVL